MNTVNKSVVKKHQDSIALICLLCAITLLCWKAPYGFGAWDESWYLTFGHRFTMGDSMVTDEWNIIQLFSFFLYLPVKVYILIVGSTEGIILFFRYLFVIFQSASSIAIYLIFRKYGPVSVFALLIFCLYLPATLMAVGYYSLTTVLAAIIGLLMSANKFNITRLITIGILFACLVLANPFFAVIYFVYLFFLIALLIRQDKNNHDFKWHQKYFSFKIWFWITLGIAVVASIFGIFLLSRTTIHEIIVNLPRVFDDPEYNVFNTGGKKQNIISIKQSALEIININPYLLTIYSTIMFAIAIDKKRDLHKLYYLIVTFVFTIVFIVFLASSSDFYKYFLCMLPLTLLGLVSYILSKNKDKSLFYFLWIWGCIVAIFEDISSNQGTKLMSLGLATSALASIVFIKNLVIEVGQSSRISPYGHKKTKYKGVEKKVAAYILIAVLMLQIGFEFYILTDLKTTSAEYFYHDLLNIAPVGEGLDVTIESGPAKGLITTRSTETAYDKMLADLSIIKDSEKGPVLILGLFPWGYLYVEHPYATYTTKYLIENYSETMNRLSKYYELHSEKYPAYIYVPEKGSLFVFNDYYDEYSTKLISKTILEIQKDFNCTVTKGSAGYIIMVKNAGRSADE